MFNHFFPSSVVTYVSDQTKDFKLREKQLSLEDDQRKFLSSQLGFDVGHAVNIQQVHGKRVVKVDALYNQSRSILEEADGIITNTINVPIVIRTADCLPIFICDVKQKCIGLVHAGWKGTQQNIVGQTLMLMYKYWHCELSDIKVAIGPAIRSCCYQVGKEVSDYFPWAIVKKDSSLYLDLPQVNKNQMINLGLPQENIFDCGICTCCDHNYFSFRRQKESAGRMISLMMLQGD